MTRAWLLVPLAVVLALIVLLYRGLELDPRLVDSPLIGKPAPSFQLPALGADAQVTEDVFKGRVSVFNVWASWCVSCRAEHDILIALARQQPDVQLVGLNYKDAGADALAWLGRLGDPYTLSVADLDGQVGIDWGVYGVPETFVVDRNGIIVTKKVGPLSWDYLREELIPLLEALQS